MTSAEQEAKEAWDAYIRLVLIPCPMPACRNRTRRPLPNVPEIQNLPDEVKATLCAAAYRKL